MLANLLTGFKLLFYMSIYQHDSLPVKCQETIFITSVCRGILKNLPCQQLLYTKSFINLVPEAPVDNYESGKCPVSLFTGTFKNVNSCRRNIEGCKGSNMKVNKYGLKLSTVQQMRRLLGHSGHITLENMLGCLNLLYILFLRTDKAFLYQNINKL